MDADIYNPPMNDTDFPNPPVSDGVPPMDILDDDTIEKILHDYVYDYLAKHYINATWPTEHEFITDLSKNCNDFEIHLQGYVDYNIQPRVRPSLFAFTHLMLTVTCLFKAIQFYRDVMAKGFDWAEQIWLKNIQQDGMDTRPLHLKCYVNGLLLSQSHLHTYYSGDSGRAIHLVNDMVLELF